MTRKVSVNASMPVWTLTATANDAWTTSDRSFWKKVGAGCPIEPTITVGDEYDWEGTPDGVTVELLEARLAYLWWDPIQARPEVRRYR